jgi:ketosteroid isomerase-like protein
MGTPEQNAELVRGGLGRWIEGDVEGTFAFLTEDIEVFVPSELGNAGTYRGHDEFRSWVGHWYEAWADYEMTVEAVQPVGERHVVATIRSRAKGRGSGIEVENLLGWLLEVTPQGTLAYLALQPDIESAVALAGEREASG